MSRYDVSIYQPNSAPLYDADDRGPSGGAELQMFRLAHALADAGLRVCHIVWERPGLPGHHRGVDLAFEPVPGPRLGQLRRAAGIAGALRTADARVVVQRSAGWEAAVVRAYTAAHRTSFVYSSANDVDFDFDSLAPGFRNAGLYRAGVGRADGLVVQTAEQVRLARRAFPRVPQVCEIPSFAEETSGAGDPIAFLWAARLVDYKQPLRYLDLAEALPDARFRMVAVETEQTPAGLAAELRRRDERLGNLEILPPRDRAGILELVSEAVAVVSTSRLEGMPNVFLEGWSRGIPALTLDFDPDGKIAERGLGFSAAGSWESFVASARSLWEGRDRRDEIAARVRAYIEEAHGAAAVGRRWAEFLSTVAARPSWPRGRAGKP